MKRLVICCVSIWITPHCDIWLLSIYLFHYVLYMVLLSHQLFKMCLFVLYCLCPFLGDYSGGMGGHHVLCDGCSLLLQLHLLYPSHHCKCHFMVSPVVCGFM